MPTAGKLTVVVLEAKNLKKMDVGGLSGESFLGCRFNFVFFYVSAFLVFSEIPVTVQFIFYAYMCMCLIMQWTKLCSLVNLDGHW